jgi:hypothetical protein
MAGDLGKSALTTIEGSDIPFDLVVFDPHSVNLDESLWEAECPNCGKKSWGQITLLGQRILCGCRDRFVFPWWSPHPESIKGLPFGLPEPSEDTIQ